MGATILKAIKVLIRVVRFPFSFLFPITLDKDLLYLHNSTKTSFLDH